MRRNKAITVYVLVTYVLSWTVFILLALNHHHIIHLFSTRIADEQQENLWHSLAAFGPFIGAIITLLIFHNNQRRKHFTLGYSLRKLNIKGWLLAFSPLFLFGVCLATGRIINHQWLDIEGVIQKNNLTDLNSLAIWLIPIVLYGFGEEAGWRGYLLPQLQLKNNAFTATLILSIFWVTWHIPSFFYRYELKGGAYLGFSLGIFAGAIWLTFLFNYTKGSILAVSLWHLLFNLVSMIVKTDVVLSAIMSAIVMVLAGIILVKYSTTNLSPFQRVSFNEPMGVGDEKGKPFTTTLINKKGTALQH